MAIVINGTELSLQPSYHGWVSKTVLGTGGAGHPFHAAVQEYELNWELVPASDLNEIINLFNAIGTTGTAVVELPEYGGLSYTYKEYSGCIVNSPEISPYFEEHTTNVRLMITNIRV